MLSQKRQFYFFCLLSSSIVLWVFGDRLLSPSSFMFSTSFDAMKNYFTFYSYVLNEGSGGCFVFNGMNYPFGDYIFFTDNTSLLAITSKYILPFIDPISLYNSFFIINLFVAGIAAFRIGMFCRFDWRLNIVFSLFSVWLSPQLPQMGGALNLSLSSIYLVAIYLFIRQYKQTKTSGMHLGFTELCIVLLIFLSALIHLYYPIILLILLGSSYLLLAFFQKKKWLVYNGMVICLLTGILIFGLIFLTDGYLGMRPTSSIGFDHDAWSGNTRDWLTSSIFLDLPSFYKQVDWSRDTIVFLGSGMLFAVAFVACFSIINGKPLSVRMPKNVLLALVFGASICFFTSLGPTIDLFNATVRLPNLLNPFFYLAYITDYGQHFRFTVRFGIPFFYVITLVIFNFFNAILSTARKSRLWTIGVLFICAIYLFDSLQAMQFSRNDFKSYNAFSPKELSAIPTFDSNEFDAILPIPYYHVGSEVRGFIIDDNDDWSRKTYQLAIKNGLPLISAKMSRTPLVFTNELFNLLLGSPSDHLLSRLSKKNILVAFRHHLNVEQKLDSPAREVVENYDLIIEKLESSFILEKDGICYFSWQF